MLRLATVLHEGFPAHLPKVAHASRASAHNILEDYPDMPLTAAQQPDADHPDADATATVTAGASTPKKRFRTLRRLNPMTRLSGEMAGASIAAPAAAAADAPGPSEGMAC